MQIDLKSGLKSRFQAEKAKITRQNEQKIQADSRTISKI
jgi:hypothetical protein